MPTDVIIGGLISLLGTFAIAYLGYLIVRHKI